MPTFTFSQISDAFERVYGSDERMKLQRMGDVGMFPRPGRGALLPYTWQHARRIVLAMEMNAMGLPLAEVTRRFESNWKKYNDWCVKAERGGREGRPAEFLYYCRQPGNESDEPVIGISKAELAKLWTEYLRGRLPRFSAINLSMRLAAMKQALKQTPPRLRGRPRSSTTDPDEGEAA